MPSLPPAARDCNVIFQRSLIREFSLIAIAVVGVLFALMLTRTLIKLLGQASVATCCPRRSSA
jgi:hypothetical protein